MKKVGVCLLLLCCATLLAAQEVTGTFAPAPEGEAPAAESSSVVSVLSYASLSLSKEKGYLSVEHFGRQLDYLKAHGLSPISPAQFLAWRAGKVTLPQHSVLITLDEADRAAYEAAFPLLKERGIPFVIFADARNLADEAGDRLGVAQLRAMQQAGAAIGSSTALRFAPYEWQFAAIAGEEQGLAEQELGQFGEKLRQVFGACDFFAAPRGYAEAPLAGYLAQYHYSAAFGHTEGKVTRRNSSFSLPRTIIHSDEDFARAVNFGGAAETEHILSVLSGREQAAEGPVFTFADDDEAEEVEDAEEVGEGAVQFAHQGHLIRRDGGDWETNGFESPLVPREQTRVAVLGYHNFSNTKPVSEMRMRTSEFCCQMQYIHDAGLSVITMEDFLQWLRGERLLPERCVLITLDDGWKSVYTDAYPVMRAYGYPFTIFLYTKYIQVQGDSMTKAQIAEMQGQGATVGSHSTSHLYPKSWKRYGRDAEKYAQQVQTEIVDSQPKLQEMFGTCSAYCYPGGYNTPPMLEALRRSPFRAAFTVLEAKVTAEEDPYLVHRYMVFGNNPTIFRRAVNFDGEEGVRPTQEGIRAAEDRARAFCPFAFPAAPLH